MSEIASDFIYVIRQNPELFSPDDIQDLKQRTWSDNEDLLEDEILDWYETREDIASAAMKNLSSKENERKVFLDDETQAPESYKQILVKVIQQSFAETAL